MGNEGEEGWGWGIPNSWGGRKIIYCLNLTNAWKEEKKPLFRRKLLFASSSKGIPGWEGEKKRWMSLEWRRGRGGGIPEGRAGGRGSPGGGVVSAELVNHDSSLFFFSKTRYQKGGACFVTPSLLPPKGETKKVRLSWQIYVLSSFFSKVLLAEVEGKERNLNGC